MPYIDLSNGDADGICALHQLRLHKPQDSSLVTGIKRDTLQLKSIVSTRDSTLTILDISSHTNRDSLLQLLKQGNSVHYIDNHFAGDILKFPLYHPHIDTSPMSVPAYWLIFFYQGNIDSGP